MLTKELLKANTALAGLTDDQIAVITTLSQNDENTVIANKTGEWAQNIERDVLESSGIEKKAGEKYFDYVKRVNTELKSKVGDNAELDKLKTELEQARKDLKENAGDKSLKAEVERLTKEVSDEKQRVKDLQENQGKSTKDWEEKLSKKDAEILSIKIDNEANAALAGLKFKDEKLIPKELRDVAIAAAKTKVLAENKPDWIDDGKGGHVLVFRDDKGQVRNNPENKLNPFSFGELLTKELSSIIDIGRQQNGGGTTPLKGQGGGGVTVGADVSQARTKVEADSIFNKAWFANQALPTSSAEYQTAYKAMRETLPADLPLR